MYPILDGATAMASLVIALFFARFWRGSGDRFFLYFALSFLVQAGHRMYTGMPGSDFMHEDNALHYLIRLLSYLLILFAVLDKNWPKRYSRK